MPGSELEAMAPLNNRSGVTGRRWSGDGPRLLQRGGLYRRQDGGGGDRDGDDGGRDRFRFGGGGNNGDDNNDNDRGGDGNGNDGDGGRRFGGFFGGGRKDDDDNGGDGDGNDRNRNGFGFGNRFGNRFGNDDDNNNDRGDGDGNRFGNGFGNRFGDGRGDGDGNGSGDGDGGRGDGDGNRFGNGFGNGGGDGNGRGDGDGNRFGNGFGNGFGNRFGNGFGRDRNGNDGDDDNSSSSSSAAETNAPSPESSTEPSPQPTTSTGATPSATEETVAPSSTADASSSGSLGVVLLQSAVDPTATVEGNPIVTTFIPLMSPSDAAGTTNLSGSEENVDVPDDSGLRPTLSSRPTPTPSSNAPPTGGPIDNNNPNNNNGGVDGAGNRLELSRAGMMDPTAERILISVGSIGGFILLCFIAWMVWRSMKKSKNNGNARSASGGFRRRIASKIPFIGKKGWQSLDDSSITKSPPPSYREKTDGARAPSVDAFFGPEKAPQQQPQQPWPQNVAEAVLREPDQMQPNSMYHAPSNPRETYTTAGRPHITLMTNVPVYSHQAQESFSSTNAAQFGTIMADRSTASPLLTGVSPISYYHKPVLSQQFTAPYNPIYRQPSHAISEVSSLSSGFGDGDIIGTTNSPIAAPAPTAAIPGSASNSPQQYTARFSWMSQQKQQQQQRQEAAGHTGPTRQNSTSSSRGGGRRETVYTETSEDQPARFRSVTSWVDQQTGRIKRVQQRGAAAGGGGDHAQEGSPPVVVRQVPGNPGVPGIHNPPSEQSFGMMMDDEERPRRVDEVVVVGGVGGVGRG